MIEEMAQLSEENKALREEIARLREALERIANAPDMSELWMSDRAKAALSRQVDQTHPVGNHVQTAQLSSQDTPHWVKCACGAMYRPHEGPPCPRCRDNARSSDSCSAHGRLKIDCLKCYPSFMCDPCRARHLAEQSSDVCQVCERGRIEFIEPNFKCKACVVRSSKEGSNG